MKNFLICGGRLYGERKFPDGSPRIIGEAELRQFADAMATFAGKHEADIKEGRVTIVNGGCKTGADKLARGLAMIWEAYCITIPARWSQYGKAAGPKRNEVMAAQKLDGVIAFPGGRGTADMVSRAREADVPVWIPFGGVDE
jgi:hypothetical protein